MTNFADKITDLLKQKSALRPVQIADLLDIDIDVVENTLTVLAKDGKVIGQPGVAPNKLPMTTYSLPPGVLNWSAPTPMTRPPVSPPVAVQGAAPVATSEEKPLSKTQKGIEFLRNAPGKVFVRDLSHAMGLTYPSTSPQAYLANHIRMGVVVRDGQWYAIGTPGERTTPLKQKTEVARKPVEKAKEETAAQKPVTPTPTVTPALNQAAPFDVFGFLQTSLSADEWRGYMKANVIDLTLRGDYAAAYEYAGRLAAAQV